MLLKQPSSQANLTLFGSFPAWILWGAVYPSKMWLKFNFDIQEKCSCPVSHSAYPQMLW